MIDNYVKQRTLTSRRPCGPGEVSRVGPGMETGGCRRDSEMGKMQNETLMYVPCQKVLLMLT